MLHYFLISTIVLTFIIVQILNFKKHRDELNNIAKHFKTPRRTKFLGHSIILKDFSIDPIQIFKTIMTFPEKYGPNLVMWGVFNHLDLVITDPKDVENIMNGKTTRKSRLYDFIEPWLGTGLLISFGNKWFQRRKIITPSFHFKILERFIDVFNEQDKVLVKKLTEKVDRGDENINIYEHVTASALDNICESAMGVKIYAQDNPDSEYIRAVKEMGEIIFNRVFSITNNYPRIWGLTENARKQKKLIKILHDFTDSVINNRKKELNIDSSHDVSMDYKDTEEDIYGSKQRLSFLDMLLQARVDGKPLTHFDIREEVDTFMFEGHDTTTSGITFTVYHLTMNPDIQEKVYNEITSIMGDDPSTPFNYNNLQDLKYLEMVIKESLRLHPSVPVIGRQALETIKIQGVDIPPGIDINIPIYAIHRNPKLYPDPLKFDPERFTEEGQAGRGPYDYIPFSAGNRNCIGQRFAMLEIKAVISTIVRNFKIIATEKTNNMDYRADLVLRPVDGMYAKLVKRN